MDSYTKILILAIIGGPVLLFSALLFGANAIDRHYSRVECERFAALSGRQCKFVEYTYWSRDCLTPASDGKWISTSQLREIPKEKP